MTNKIDYESLRTLLENDETPEDQLAEFFVAGTFPSPMNPQLRINEERVNVPRQRGTLLNLTVGFLNRWAERRRLLRFQQKIDQGFKGLRLMAEGDSWFQFPILRKDVIDCLDNEFAIFCTSAAGDTIRNMAAGVEDLVRRIDEHQPHALLFSGGGNDVAGEPLISYLKTARPGYISATHYLTPAFIRFLEDLEIVLTAFYDRIALHHPDLPIFCHGYDWPLPRPGGRWLHPVLEQYTIPAQFRGPILKLMIDAYYTTLQKIAARTKARLVVVDCRGVVGERTRWFDELHPLDPGYARVAERFRAAIHAELGDHVDAATTRSGPPGSSAAGRPPGVPKAPSVATSTNSPPAFIASPEPHPGSPASVLQEDLRGFTPERQNYEEAEPRFLDIELISGNIVNVASPAYAVGIFEHVEPSGGVREIDELLGHRLSSLIQAGLFGCKTGEISLLPIPQQRLMSETIVFAGLGPISAYHPATLKTVAENLARVITVARIDEISCVPIGLGSGTSVPEYATNFLSGFLDGLSAGDPNEDFYSLQICEYDEEKYTNLAGEIARLIASGFFKERGFEVHVRHSTVSHQSVVDPTTKRGRESINPLYLEASWSDTGAFEYFLLGGDHGGAIKPVRQPIDEPASQMISAQLSNSKNIDEQTGRELADSFLPKELQQLINRNLQTAPNAHLVVLHDKVASSIPWEALYPEGRCPALETGLSRIYKTTGSRHASGKTSLPRDSVLNVLIIENPTANHPDIQDLPGATREGNYLAGLFAQPGSKVTVIEEDEATRDNIINELQGRRYDILHYTGHANFDENDPGNSGLLCYDATLVARDMNAIQMPQLVFFNGCESGRMRSAQQGTGLSAMQANISLAESLLHNGVANFIGTYWKVYDDPALEFATQFYSSLLTGNPIGLAMQKGRNGILALKTGNERRDWANYQHFGDPTYRLRQP